MKEWEDEKVEKRKKKGGRENTGKRKKRSEERGKRKSKGRWVTKEGKDRERGNSI